MRRWFLACAALLLAACESVPALPEFRDRTPVDIAGFFDCVRERSLTVIAAHRGGDQPAENAIATFERTLGGAPGPVLIEIDVRRTRDGVLVLMHDETLDRTTNGAGPVAAIDAAAFRRLKLKDEGGRVLDASPPTLQQALEWSRNRVIVQLDVKRGTPFEEVVAAVRAARAENRAVIITYNTADAFRVHRLAPELMISASPETIRELEGAAYAPVDFSRFLAWTGTREPDPALNVSLAQKGVEVAFGTLGRPETSWDGRFAREGDAGYTAFADTGLHIISTDRPLEAMRAIDDVDGEGAPATACLAARRTS
ncbi:MAG: glycerophosphodiester phosphodiesterase family protein [Hyphomonadaceae bacterium]|nr:glycerophosphodiester phosphodiesterase family protein [Hyphomonadaceae bacterium]